MGCVYSEEERGGAERSVVQQHSHAECSEELPEREAEPNAPREFPMIELIKTKRMLYVENIQITFREEYIKQNKKKMT